VPFDLAPGVEIAVAPPVVPAVRAQPPSGNVAVVPVAGPPGPAGSGYHRHEQTIPASVVTIEHGFGRWPAAILLTSLDGSVTFTTFGVEMIDLNTIRISIDKPTAYTAMIS
jgi:hypothetical protein